MKVLLISPNVETLPDPVFPIGLAYIAAAVKRKGFQCQVLDLCFKKDYEAAIESSITSFEPDVIGLSLRNIDNVSYPNYISYLPFCAEVVKKIRLHAKGSIIIGGSGFSLMPDEVLQYLGGDFGVVGEGERSFVDLLKRLEGEKEGVAESQRPGAIEHEPGIIKDLDDIPLPDRPAFDNAAYLKWGGMGNLQTKRGCPFKCVYCTYPIIEGKEVRVRSPERVCNEIEGMMEQGISNVFIVDNEFNYPLDHAEAICREMIRRKLPVQWSCYAHPGFVTPQLVELMLEAGCTGLEFGSDAASEAMLKNLGKGFTLEDLKEASSICRKTGMPFCHSLLLGGPGETMETVRETIKAIEEMSPTAIICMIGIRVFPRTRLSFIAVKEGIAHPEADFLRPVFYLSPAIENEIVPFLKKFSKRAPNWVFPGLNINMYGDLQKKLRRFGVKGPLWEHMKVGERFRKNPKLT
ncbi:MAG: radical SAM protein [Deltaproteobacteria bacterium]|nr:radical SAM protein [Deltaproteobacteria bacterium]